MSGAPTHRTPRLALRYDLRAPDFGASTSQLYGAALEQASWADNHGFAAVSLSEHHSSDDGYCPSPVVMAAAVAARTTHVRISITALVLPLYDPVRLAEDLAVLDIISEGRLDLVMGAGYRSVEMQMFGHTLDDRVRLLEEGISFLRSAWTGEAFEYDGRTIRIRPTPLQPGGPPLKLAGSTPGAARRAARIADGFVPVDASLWTVYTHECAQLDRDPGPTPSGGGPLFVHVTHDPERDWAAIAPHALHETNSYAGWLAELDGARPYSPMDDADQLRASGLYAVLTPDECVALIGQQGGLTLHPLMGGLSPDLAWSSLEMIAAEVLPRLPS